VTVTRTKKSFAEADMSTLLVPSLLRAVPRCRYFGACGGCKWQQVAYDAQCVFKRQHVVDALERIGGFAGIEVAPTLGAVEPYYYRNKMEFSFGDRWRRKTGSTGIRSDSHSGSTSRDATTGSSTWRNASCSRPSAPGS
jgi:tRNA/tmRNA/rRNA uracil-C5-methylase (TrmA/RlmC/RlmD family)